MRYKKIHSDAKITKAYDSAGYDLYNTMGRFCLSGVDARAQEFTQRNLKDFDSEYVQKIHTGVAIEIPEGHVGLIRDRSSLGSRGIIVSAGVIDSDYRGEVIVCLINLNPFDVWIDGAIAQILVIPIYEWQPIVVAELSDTKRGGQGFGSSDKEV